MRCGQIVQLKWGVKAGMVRVGGDHTVLPV